MATTDALADRCDCRHTYRSPDPADHDDGCPGADPDGWRARVPEFLLDPLAEVDAGSPMPERYFVAQAVAAANRARSGPTPAAKPKPKPKPKRAPARKPRTATA